uniref:Urea transporter n=1 Tax=Rodentolepis nana TaxID=102285 RepID=A0A0R3TB29_RODNA
LTNRFSYSLTLNFRERQFARKGIKYYPRCAIHAEYRRYIEHSTKVRIYTIYVILAAFLSAAMLIDFQWISTVELRYHISTLCASLIGSIYYAFYWARVTPLAVIIGLIVGVLSGIGFSAASFFISATLSNAAPLIECGAGFIVPAIATFITTSPLNEEETLDVWERTRSIDDPLQPWAEVYSKDLGIRNAHLLTEGRPRLDDVQRAFSFSSTFLNYSIAVLLVIYLAILPAMTLLSDELYVDSFQTFMFITLTWLSTAFVFLVIIPPVFAFEKARELEKEQKTDKFVTDVSENSYT